MKTQEEWLQKLHKDSSLKEVQEYIKQVIDIRGFGNQPIEQVMLLLLEETGELAKAVRKDSLNTSIDKNRIENYDTVESEVADY